MSGASMLAGGKAAEARGRANADAFIAQGNQSRETAAQQRDQAEEVALQAETEEANRLAVYTQMTAANAADLPTRGVSDSASTQAILDQNREAVGRDLLAVKYMGTARSKRLLRSADQNDRAADIFYRGGQAAIAQGERESSSSMALGGWQMLSSMPNMFKMMGSAFGGGGGSVTARYDTSAGSDASALGNNAPGWS
jgi:predicted DNA-binding protein (UPF0251 family)